MRRSFIIAVFLAALFFSASAAAAPLFVVTGRGWGHGIGMSQWGAQGFARHGSTYREILTHYYRGTSVREGYGRTVGVLLASGRSSLSVGSDAVFTVTSGGRTYRMRAGAHTIRPSLIITDVNGKKHDLASPATFRRGTRPIELGGARYRGALVVRSNGSALSAANRLTLDGYVKGVVPREMPASWLLEALKTQAVAARSYALAAGGHCSFGGKPVFCATISDQVYGGMDGETAATNRAVDATAGEAVVYPGAGVATTFFFSTSGGKTSSKHDEWGGARIPYLVSVRDPYDSISYHHFWGPRDRERDCERTSPDCVFTARQLRLRLGLPFTPRDLTVGARNRSSRVAYVNAIGATPRQIPGATMRTRLGLRSTWFSVGVISLQRVRARVVFGNRTTVRGLARGVLRPRLQRKAHGGSWVDLAPIDPAADGTWSRVVRPSITTSYRVVSGRIAGIARAVYVAPRVGFYKPENRAELRGVVRPAKEGARVAVQKKQSDGTWATVATTTTNSAGEFIARFRVTNGTYRAVARIGAGYVAGYSPALGVSS